MKILVTGGLGFIGGTFIEMFHKDYDIVNLDSFSYAAKPERLYTPNPEWESRFPNVCTWKADISNKKEVFDSINLVNGGTKCFDLIINFAADTHVDNSIANPYPFLMSNVVGTVNLLEACRNFNIPMIHISTDEVVKHFPRTKYTNYHNGFVRVTEKEFNNYPNSDFDSANYYSFPKISTFDPSSPYSASKASAEMYIKAYRKTYGVEVDVIRPCNQYGPWQHTEKLIPKTISKLLKGDKVPVFKTLAYRDWCYVEDLCRAINLIVQQKTRGEVYHVSAYNEKSTIDVVTKIIQLMGVPHDGGLIHHCIEMVEDRAGYDLTYSIDSKKIRKLGWKPEIDFEEGLRRTIEFYNK